MAISVNVARNTVLFLINKSNRGYLGVEEMNSHFRLAQLDIFEQLFYDYNQWVNKQNRRLSGTEYADIPKNLREIIDIFAEYTTTSNFTYDSTDNLWSYTGNDFYRTENLSLANTVTGKKIDIEEVSKRELNVMKNSSLTAPSTLFPVYEKVGNDYRVYPTLSTPNIAEMFYIRKPRDPKFTYTSVNGNPMYNASATDLQHIELPESLFSKFIVKVLSYSGISIREQDVVAISNQEETQEFQKQQ